MKKLFALLLLAALLCSAVGCSDGGTTAPTFAGIGNETASRPEATTRAPETAAPTAAPATAAPGTEAPATEAPATEAPVTEAPETEAPATETPTAPPATEAPTEAPEPVDPWTLMEEPFFSQGTYEDALGNLSTYSYALPAIDADTPGAREINEDIDRVFGGMIREAEQAMEDHLSLAMYHVGYRGEVWEDVLTLVVMAHWDWSFEDYGIYCYDVTAGRRLDTPALLEKMGVSAEDFLEACRVQFRQFFEDMYSSLPVEQRTDAGYYDALNRTASPEFVNLELRAFPTAEGDIAVIAPIVSLAGADFYYHTIYLGIGGAG